MLDVVKRVIINCRSSRMDVVVVSDHASCSCGAISGPLRLALGCGLDGSKGKERNRTVCLNTKGRQLLLSQILETEMGGE